jgi:hypothetical protein
MGKDITMTIEQLRTKTPADKTQSVKVRLCHVFKREGQTNVEIMQEVKALTERDFADFAQWFDDAGLPTTYTA